MRPRQWLEIRYLDTLPDALWPAVVFTLVTLLDDPVAADLAAEAVEPVATAWDMAARLGLRDRRLHAAANSCVAIAAERAPAELTDAMRRLVATSNRADVRATISPTRWSTTASRLRSRSWRKGAL